MLTHIVAWKYRADVEQSAREEHVKVAEFGRSISEHVVSVDFTS